MKVSSYLYELAERLQKGGELIEKRLGEVEEGHVNQVDQALASLETVERASAELRRRLHELQDGDARE